MKEEKDGRSRSETTYSQEEMSVTRTGASSKNEPGSRNLTNDAGNGGLQPLQRARRIAHLRDFLSRNKSKHINVPVESSAGSGGLIIRSFVVCVVVPVFLAAVYYSIFASDVFVTETKITVRQATEIQASGSLASSFLGKIGLGKNVDTAQDSMIVLDYLKSRSVIIDIGGKAVMGEFFDRPDVDWLSRLDSTKDLETIWSYWGDKVTASVDTSSNILTMRVRAYRPGDALSLARILIAKSELLINQISQRSRKDTLDRATAEVQRSMSELAAVRTQILEFQQRTGSIDPLETAKQITNLISTLTIQKIELENQLSAASYAGVRGRPGDIYNATRLEVLDKQIADLNALLLGKTGAGTISNQLKDYEILKLREEFAEQMYMLARSSFEDARKKLDKQQLYLVVVVPPILPELAAYPRVFANTGLVALGSFILWAIAALIFASVRDSQNL